MQARQNELREMTERVLGNADARRLAAQMSATSDALKRSIGVFSHNPIDRRLAGSLTNRFVVPLRDEYRNLAQGILGTNPALLDNFSGAAAALKAFEYSVRGIKAPWIDALNPTASVAGMLQLQALG